MTTKVDVSSIRGSTERTLEMRLACRTERICNWLFAVTVVFVSLLFSYTSFLHLPGKKYAFFNGDISL